MRGIYTKIRSKVRDPTSTVAAVISGEFTGICRVVNLLLTHNIDLNAYAFYSPRWTAGKIDFQSQWLICDTTNLGSPSLVIPAIPIARVIFFNACWSIPSARNGSSSEKASGSCSKLSLVVGIRFSSVIGIIGAGVFVVANPVIQETEYMGCWESKVQQNDASYLKSHMIWLWYFDTVFLEHWQCRLPDSL